MKWQTWLIIALLIAVAFLTWKSCNQNPTEEVKKGDSAFSVIAGTVKIKDSIISALKWQKDSIDAEKIGLADANEMLTEQSLFNEGRIKLITGILNKLKRDTVKTFLSATCDSLALYADEQVGLTQEARWQYNQLDTLCRYEIAIRDTAFDQLEVAYNSAVSAALTAQASFNKLKPKNQIYLGATGVYNPLVYGAGASLMWKTKKDKIYSFDYIITNRQPLWKVGAAFKISFK